MVGAYAASFTASRVPMALEVHSAASTSGGGAMDNIGIKTAVAAWFRDRAAAEAEYGLIEDWDTSAVTDMSYLFSAYPFGSYCNPGAEFFNEDAPYR